MSNSILWFQRAWQVGGYAGVDGRLAVLGSEDDGRLLIPWALVHRFDDLSKGGVDIEQRCLELRRGVGSGVGDIEVPVHLLGDVECLPVASKDGGHAPGHTAG
jgi:hypothetical protein